MFNFNHRIVMRKFVFTIAMFLGASCIAFSQTIKTFSISFDKSFWTLWDMKDGTFFLDVNPNVSLSDPSLIYTWNGVEYRGGRWSWASGSEGINIEKKPLLLWADFSLPIDESEGFDSYTVEMTEELVVKGVLLSPYSRYPIPVSSAFVSQEPIVSSDGNAPFYNKSQYPKSNIENIRLEGYGFYNGQRVEGRMLSFSVCPFRYETEGGDLYLLTNVKVDFIMKQDSTPTPLIPVPFDFNGDRRFALDDVVTAIERFLNDEIDFWTIERAIDAYLEKME